MRYADREQETKELLLEQASAGLSKKDFCTDRQINPGTFYSWQRRLNEENESPVGFQQLSPICNFAAITLTLPHGISLEVSSDDIEVLAALVYAIDKQYA